MAAAEFSEEVECTGGEWWGTSLVTSVAIGGLVIPAAIHCFIAEWKSRNGPRPEPFIAAVKPVIV